jgi:hypothetical protein
VKKSVNVGFPVASGTYGWLIMGLAYDVDSDVAKALDVFRPARVTDAGGVLGLRLGSTSA